MLDVLDSVASGVLHLVVVIVLIGPFMWWGARQRGEQLFATSAARSLVLAATVYLVAMAMLRLPQLGFYDDLQFNWVNKALIFVALLLLIRLLPEISWRDVGIKLPGSGWWKPVLAMIAFGADLASNNGPVYGNALRS